MHNTFIFYYILQKCYLSDADDEYQQAVLEAIDEAERYEGSKLIPEVPNPTIPESPPQIDVY